MTHQIFQGLNPQQKKAVEILTGPLLILAGAGSGKTKSLTHRIAHLIATGVHPDQILAVTFTNKAANEMKTRIESLLQTINGQTGSRLNPTVGTFHSICVRILRRDIEKMARGYSSNFVIFDTADAQSLMKIIMKEKGIDEKEIKHKAVLSHISTAKNQLITPVEYAENTEDNRFTIAVKKLYPLYQKRLQEHNALDFDDLLQKTVELYENCPEVLQKYKRQWQHISVDEYQDTNFAQYRMIRLLADQHQNLCVIGDDYQSIYSFRGADYTNILNFEKDFPNTQTIKLEQNYRSSGKILSNANTLIAKNETGHPKKLWTENQDGHPVEITEVYDEKDEGRFIVDKIKELTSETDYTYKDFTVLYRMNAQSRALEEAFMRAQIPYQIIGGTKFFDRREIKDILAYLRLIFNPRDDVAFLRVINVPKRKIGPASIEVLKKYSEMYDMSLFSVLQHASEIDELPETKRKVFKDFYEIIRRLQAFSLKNPISILLDHLLESIEYMKFLDDGTAEGEARMQNVKELFSVAGKYEAAEDSLASFLEGVALIADIDNMQQNTEAVTMMTIHSSKGLEFPVVFLPGWEDGIFPSGNAQHSREGLEEERRLGYVAITRAEERCFISHARQRLLFGRTEYAAPSPFLSELDESAIKASSFGSPLSTRSSFATQKTTSTETSFAPLFVPKTKKEALFGVQENTSGYAPGERIRHAQWGEGTIILVSGDVLSVAFPGEGMKKIVASVAPIEKI